jgi:hypothetical protein
VAPDGGITVLARSRLPTRFDLKQQVREPHTHCLREPGKGLGVTVGRFQPIGEAVQRAIPRGGEGRSEVPRGAGEGGKPAPETTTGSG